MPFKPLRGVLNQRGDTWQCGKREIPFEEECVIYISLAGHRAAALHKRTRLQMLLNAHVHANAVCLLIAQAAKNILSLMPANLNWLIIWTNC